MIWIDIKLFFVNMYYKITGKENPLDKATNRDPFIYEE